MAFHRFQHGSAAARQRGKYALLGEAILEATSLDYVWELFLEAVSSHFEGVSGIDGIAPFQWDGYPPPTPPAQSHTDTIFYIPDD